MWRGGYAFLIFNFSCDILAAVLCISIMPKTMPEHFELLLEVHEALRPYYLHFGYRVANEIAAFMLNTRKYCADGDDALSSTFDLQVLQKILPKMHGAVNSVAWRRAWSRWGSRPSLSRQAWRAEMLRWRAGR